MAVRPGLHCRTKSFHIVRIAPGIPSDGLQRKELQQGCMTAPQVTRPVSELNYRCIRVEVCPATHRAPSTHTYKHRFHPHRVMYEGPLPPVHPLPPLPALLLCHCDE